MRSQQRELFPPHIRSIISRAMSKAGEWEDRRYGYKYRICYTDQTIIARQTADTKTFTWKVRVNQIWHYGTAATVFDALNSIEEKAAQS